MEKKTYTVEGMTCSSCEVLIGKRLLKLQGVKGAKATLLNNSVDVEFDPKQVNEEKIKDALKEAGYPVKEGRGVKNNWLIVLGAALLFVGFYFALEYMSAGNSLNFAQIDPKTSYAILFAVGLVTGLHCIAMCGGFVLSYSMKAKRNDMMPHLYYGAGKLISYTAIGAFFGLLGSFIAFTVELRIAVAMFAGLFLIVYGLGMLNVIPKFLTSKLSMPGPISRFREKLAEKGPFATGIATGFFVACGPLQAMYILAAGSGSIVFGGLALFFFGLGTLPVMLGFSYVSSMISQVMARRITRYSGVLVVLLGLVMLNNAMVLSGVQLVPSGAVVAGTQAQSSQLATGSGAIGGSASLEGNDSYQTIRMNVTRFGFEPDTFVIKKGVPVKWIINGVELNGCNSEIIVREYGLDIKVKKGEQTIEFTPNAAKTVSWSCWMGMIPGKFIVVEDDAAKASTTQALSAGTIAGAKKTGSSGGSCGMASGGSCGGGSGGGCGCGCGAK
ncbi:MAG: sulfite exporter TauE/SafE family protein [Candidatus Micrarchaeota archaeon]